MREHNILVLILRSWCEARAPDLSEVLQLLVLFFFLLCEDPSQVLEDPPKVSAMKVFILMLHFHGDFLLVGFFFFFKPFFVYCMYRPCHP